VFPVPAAPVFPVPAAPVFPVSPELAPDVVLVVVVLVEVDEVALDGALSVGTVSVGAPEVSVWGEPPPQAETPRARATPAERAAIELAMRARREVTAQTSGPERIHPTSAVRAVVQILLSELVAPITEAEILDCPGKLRRRGRQGKDDGHGLHRLVRLPVHVRAPGLGLDDHLATALGRPQAILLVEPHRFDATSGQETRHHRRSLG
jgi:hypothetical protein